MAVSPLEMLDEFNKDDQLYIVQMIEPTVLMNDAVYRIGTVVGEGIQDETLYWDELGTTNSAICSYDGKNVRIWEKP